MNTGIQDAYNLGWKLAAGSGDLLDTYQEERLPIAAWTLETSAAGNRAAARGMHTASGGVDLAVTADSRQLGLHYRWSSLSRDLIDREYGPRAGDRAPDAPLRTADGARVRLFDILRGPRFTLLGFGDGCADTLCRLAGRIPTRLVTDGETAAADAVVDDGGHAFSTYGIEIDTLVLVRPDGYLGLTAAGDDAGGVLDYLAAVTK